MPGQVGITPKSVVGGVYNGTTTLPFMIDSEGKIITGNIGGNGVETQIGSDAWGRMKVIYDVSIFHGLFTYDIPATTWLVFESGVEVSNATSTRVTSVDGKGTIRSGASVGNTGFLRGKRHPRYQPNRGHLYSTAGFLPSPSAVGIRQLGLLNTIAKVCFSLESGVLYAVIVDDSVEVYKQVIDLTAIGLTVSSLQYGHLYDIQFQWRGVGDFFFFIDQKLVHTANFLGTNTELTIENPALSAGFYCENTNGTQVIIEVGCVDITSEGGSIDEAEYRSVVSPTAKSGSIANYPLIILQSLNTFKTKPNTRDLQFFRATANVNQRSFMKLWKTRDATAFTGASFVTHLADCSVLVDYSATAIDTAKCTQIWSKRIEIDSSGFVDMPSPTANLFITPGDYLILTIERESPLLAVTSTGVIEFGEEI